MASLTLSGVEKRLGDNDILRGIDLAVEDGQLVVLVLVPIALGMRVRMLRPAWAEARGPGLRRLTREHCDHLVSLPMRGRVESLNVSVATGICLYEIQRARDACGAP